MLGFFQKPVIYFDNLGFINSKMWLWINFLKILGKFGYVFLGLYFSLFIIFIGHCHLSNTGVTLAYLRISGKLAAETHLIWDLR